MEVKGEWFNAWFDSEYYPILYSHRDFEEAKAFIDVLDGLLEFRSGQKALDAACGRGRHAIYLNEKGLDVTGIDISSKSIGYAGQFETENLHFLIHDIRIPLKGAAFDYIFNLFTSFGYFDEGKDNLDTLKAFHQELRQGGILVLDFLNPDHVLENLVAEEVREESGITFHIRRETKNDFLLKEISFKDQGKDFQFCEKVRLIRKEEFLNYFNFAGFSIQHIFGNYKLEEFEEKKSERMIFIAEKK